MEQTKTLQKTAPRVLAFSAIGAFILLVGPAAQPAAAETFTCAGTWAWNFSAPLTATFGSGTLGIDYFMPCAGIDAPLISTTHLSGTFQGSCVLASAELSNGWTLAIVGGSAVVATSGSAQSSGFEFGTLTSTNGLGNPCGMRSAIGPVSVTVLN